MKAVFFICAILTFLIKASASDETNASAAKKIKNLSLLKIGTADATNHYDQEMIVTGKVAQVTVRTTVTFLNLDKYPTSPFTVVIIHGHSDFLGDASALKGKSIEIRGRIKNYHDKPEILLDSTNQLTVSDLTNSVGKVKRKAKKTPAISAPDNATPVRPSTNSFPEIM